MKHKTYQTIYQGHLGNVDRNALLQARAEETDPFYHNVIDLMLGNKRILVPWDTRLFTTDFRTGSPREKLDETVLAFILRIVVIVKEETYLRTFRKPESHDAIMAWQAILRKLILTTFALLYNVQWTVETIFTFLEPAVLQLSGNEDASLVMRQLMKQVGITLARDTPYQAEQHVGRLNFLHVGQYGSFYWRFLHWMAEAYDLRKNEIFYKQEWLNLINGPLYRTLRCGICKYHFRNILNELKPQLEEANFSKLWFDIHNRVHAQKREQYTYLKEPDYTESEYDEDRSFMLQALSP